MTWCSGLILLLAMIALQLARGASTPLQAQFVQALWLPVAILVAAKVVATVLRRDRPPPSWICTLLVAIGGFGAMVLYATVQPTVFAAEEHIVIALLCGAGAIFVLHDDLAAMSRAVCVCMIVILLMLPGVDEGGRALLIVAGTVAGSLWLFVTQSVSGGKWAWAMGMGACALLAGWVALADRFIQPTDGNPSYAAFVNSSGGGESGSEHARRGVGDGPDELSGNAPDSLGFDDSDTFSESGKDGLYDLWIESYGAPATPDQSQKMIGLKPQDVKIAEASVRENLKSGRKFDLHRQLPKRPPSGSPDSPAAAAVWVKGPMPVYVPLAVFDRLEGASWSAVDDGARVTPVRQTGEGSWMEILLRPLSPAFEGYAAYQLRVGTMGGDVLPLPMHVDRFRMGRVNRPQFFDSARWGGIRLARRTLPPGATLDVVCKHVDPARLAAVEPARVSHSNPTLLDDTLLPDDGRSMARQWGAGRERGWLQIEQVIGQLRSFAVYDRAHRVPSDADPVRDLLDVRRGTDYQFATTGVLMLRSLGYPARLTSGLFAEESHVDERSGFASLDASHTHFWPEVRLADGTWIAVDATPGYPLINIPTSLGEKIAGLWRESVSFVGSHHLVLIVSLVLVSVVTVARRWIVDRTVTFWCLWRGCPPLAVLKVIETRCRLLGQPRQAHSPVGRWLATLGHDPALAAFIAQVNTILYGAPHPSVEASAREVLQGLTRDALRKTHRGDQNE